MRFRATGRIAGLSLIAALASTTALTAAHADYLIGAGQYPAPGSDPITDFSGSGSSITTGGLTATYTLHPSQYTNLWWGPQSISASMNGPGDDHPLAGPFTLTNGGMTATWTGSTTINDGGILRTVYTEFVATILSGAPLGWISPGGVPISGTGSTSPLEVAQLTGSSFSVNEQFLASYTNGSGYQAFSTLFFNAETPCCGGLEMTDFSGGFWYTSAVPEPSTWAMMILGFAGIGFTAYRKRDRSRPRFRLA